MECEKLNIPCSRLILHIHTVTIFQSTRKICKIFLSFFLYVINNSWMHSKLSMQFSNENCGVKNSFWMRFFHFEKRKRGIEIYGETSIVVKCCCLPASPQFTQHNVQNIISVIHNFQRNCCFVLGTHMIIFFTITFVHTRFQWNLFLFIPWAFANSSHVSSINKVVLLLSFCFPFFFYPTPVPFPFTTLSSSSRKFVTSIRRLVSLYRFADAKKYFPIVASDGEKIEAIAQNTNTQSFFLLNMCGRPKREKRALTAGWTWIETKLTH